MLQTVAQRPLLLPNAVINIYPDKVAQGGGFLCVYIAQRPQLSSYGDEGVGRTLYAHLLPAYYPACQHILQAHVGLFQPLNTLHRLPHLTQQDVSPTTSCPFAMPDRLARIQPDCS